MSVKCPKCNSENPDTQSFCGDCGTQLVPIEEASVTKTLQTPLASPGKTIAGKYKILAELTKNKEAKDRFIQEAQAAAALNHPQICTIYEVDEAEKQIFIAMEYIEGQCLKDKLTEGRLAIDELFRFKRIWTTHDIS